MAIQVPITVEVPTQKWYQSKIVKLAGALILASVTLLGLNTGYLNPDDLDSAKTVYPQVVVYVDMIRTGTNIAGGVLGIIGVLIGYFRIFNTTKVITKSLPKINGEAA